MSAVRRNIRANTGRPSGAWSGGLGTQHALPPWQGEVHLTGPGPGPDRREAHPGGPGERRVDLPPELSPGRLLDAGHGRAH